MEQSRCGGRVANTFDSEGPWSSLTADVHERPLMAESDAVDLWLAGDEIEFDLSVRYSTHDVTVCISGEIDALTAPALRGLLAGLIDAGEIAIVVDAVALDFMDASGLGVIAVIVRRLRSVGGALSIRSPSVSLRQLLEIASMTDLIETEPSDAEPSTPDELGREQLPGDHSASVGSAPPRLDPSPTPQSPAFPSGTGIIDAALRMVTEMARATVGGADGVSVSLTRHGELTTVAATDNTILKMDRNQYDTGEGPCLSAAGEGHWFHVESLAEEDRWPQFIPRAIDEGIASILSTPLLVAGRPVGALNIYSNTERAFGPHDQELAALFATQASGILAEGRVDMTTDEVAQRLRNTLRVREVIAQAQGVIMARQGISAHAAYANLRQSSKKSGTTIRKYAESIVAATLRADLIGGVTK